MQALGRDSRHAWTVILAALLALAPRVAAHGQTPPASPSTGAAKGKPGKPHPDNELMNEGDEVDGNAAGAAGRGAAKAGGADKAKAPAPGDPGAAAVDSQKPEWSVLLMTFTDQGHLAAANAMREAIVTRYPKLSAARVRAVENGSAIVYGSFIGLDDPKAKPALKMVKEIEENGVRPFSRAYLVRLQTTTAAVGPYDLSKVRARFPNVVPLFTVKVATWSDFKSGEIPFADIQRKAEAYCAELRMQGFESYVKHDADDRSSTVTIGVFDSTAYDARSTLFHPDVERIMKKFPAMRVNGEPLLEPPPRGLANAKPTPKPCVLIEIPR
jgi:cell division septation protein DedD